MKSLMDVKVLENLDMSDLQDLDVSDIIDKLLGVLMALETSNDFERAVYDCLRECLYDGFYKITPQLFDDKPETREVYYCKVLRGKPHPFFQESCFRIQSSISDDSKRKPDTTITAEWEIVIAVTLAKSGYFAGNPDVVLNTPIDIVLHTYHYEMFTRDYETTYYELNKEV